MTDMDLLSALLYQLYRTERRLPQRNYAKDHSFDEWREHEQGLRFVQAHLVTGRGRMADLEIRSEKHDGRDSVCP